MQQKSTSNSKRTWRDRFIAIRCLTLLIGVFTTSVVCGQSPYFQQYFLLKKNESVQIESIMKDRQGFMWFGTNKGLFRFDGINTKRFTVADSLSIDHVTALAQDSTGVIWIGHKNGQLSKIDRDVISKVQFREGDATEEISDILFSQDGTMWFSTLNDGLYYHKQDRLYRLDEADGMPDLFVYDLEEDNEGKIWAGTDRGVALVSLDSTSPSLKVLDYKNGFPDNIIKKIVRGSNDEMWLATEDAGIFSYRSSTSKTHSLINTGWPGRGINDFLKLGDEFWIASSNGEIMVYDQKDLQLSFYHPADGIAPTALYTDEEGSVWIGARNGLFRSLGRDVRFIDDVRDVLAITIDQKNNLWFSTDEGLFKRAIDKDGKVNIEKIKSVATKIISLYTDKLGNVWCGTYGNGVFILDPITGSQRTIRNGLSNGSILSISGIGSRIWLSTLNGASVIDIDKNYQITNYDRSKGLDCDYVYQVFIDSRGREWFASDREGVAMRDDSGFHKMIGSLSAKAVYGFAEDGKGNIWANVQDDGLYKFDGKNFAPGILRNININCLSSDMAGNLVAVHDLGIEIYNPATGIIHHLDNEIGFGYRKPNLNATARDAGGAIYFGTDAGIVIYNQYGLSNAKPKVAIDRIRVFDKYKSLSGKLSLSHEENNITITFLGFWYQDPQGINFQYKLEDFDVDWITTGDRTAVFSSLEPGTYKFRVRASADTNFDNASEDSITFIIRPPFWRTSAFYIIIGLLLAFAAYAYIQYRERNLLREKVELEEKIAERTAEILKKNEEIQAQAEEIKAINESLEKRVAERTFELEKKNKALEDYAFINAHKLRSPVASILGLINLISHARTEEESKEIVDHMKISAEKLDEVVQSITESIEKGDRSYDVFKADD